MTNIGISHDERMTVNGAKHSMVDDYPYLAYAPANDIVVEESYAPEPAEDDSEPVEDSQL